MNKTAQKKMDKSQNKFAAAVDHIFAADSKENANWCKKQLDDHPEWVPFLTSLFRRGTFEQMMQRETEKNSLAENEKQYGRLMHSRVKRLDKVPGHVKVDFLKSVNKLIDTSTWDDDIISKAFSWALLIGPQTPLPTEEVFKQEGALLLACQYHYISQAQKPLHRRLPPELSDFFNLLSDGKVSFAPMNITFDLPGGWTWIGSSSTKPAWIASRSPRSSKVARRCYCPW